MPQNIDGLRGKSNEANQSILSLVGIQTIVVPFFPWFEKKYTS